LNCWEKIIKKNSRKKKQKKITKFRNFIPREDKAIVFTETFRLIDGDFILAGSMGLNESIFSISLDFLIIFLSH
jgi:hypothetical protein